MHKRDQTPEESDLQLRAVQDAARELECDDDPERLDERLKRLAKAPRPDESNAPDRS